MVSGKPIENFGRNLRFRPKLRESPRDEAELLRILESSNSKMFRVVASKHAWSDLIHTQETLLDLSAFNAIGLFESEGEQFVRIGAGCQIKHLISYLNEKGLTLPSIGLITEQRIAGAISTGTHGSGKHSLSHYVTAVKIACFPNGRESSPEVRVIDGGIELEAARCSLGCLGVITEVTLPVIPQYLVQEKATFLSTVEETLALEERSPLQQFFLMPHSWNYIAQERSLTDRKTRSGLAWLYQIHWFLAIDLGMHLGILLTARWLRNNALTRFLFRHVIPLFVFPKWIVVDRSDRILTMEHELFRHLELELFVPRSKVIDAAILVERVLQWADGIEVSFSEDETQAIHSAGVTEELQGLKGSYSHHYPVCFRKILADDTLISMAAGTDEAWYSISLINYVEPRDSFYRVVTVLAKAIVRGFGGRLHWGKWFPLDRSDTDKMYPRMNEFREVCQQFDPDGIFRNEFLNRTIFKETASP